MPERVRSVIVEPMALSPEMIAQEQAYALRRLRAAAGSAIFQDISAERAREEFEAGLAEAQAELDRVARAQADADAAPRPPAQHGPAARRLIDAVAEMERELQGRHRAA